MSYAPTTDLYQIRLTYTTVVSSVALPHVAALWVKPNGTLATAGTPWLDIEIIDQSGAPQPLSVPLNFFSYMAQQLHTTSTFVGYELWAYVADSNDPHFVTALASGAAGVSASPTVSAQQTILTARCLDGGIWKSVWLETVNGNNNIADWNVLDSAPYDDMALFVTLGQTEPLVFTNRHGSYAFVPLRRNNGQNESIWRKRNRPNT